MARSRRLTPDDALPIPPIRGLWRTDERARAAYAEGAGIYRIVPRAVCIPRDTDDLPPLVDWATVHGVALVPRGAGSGMAGHNVGDGVVVDLTRLTDAALAVDPERARARTGAPIALSALNRAAAPCGLRLPPDPSSARWATAGGVVSTNAAGARSVRYGSVRRWVEALTLVTADGETVRLARGEGHDGPPPRALALRRFEETAAPAIRAHAALVAERWPRTRKNSSGYALDAWLASGDALDLVIGAEGTLGLVTEVEWRLAPLPAGTAALRIVLDELERVADLVAALLPLQPSALELLDRTFLDLVADGGLSEGLQRLIAGAAAVVLVELEAEDAGAIPYLVEDAARAARPHAARVEVATDAAEIERLWAIRHAASPILASLPADRRSLQVIEDGCVPIERLAEYVRAVRAAAERHRLDVVIFGHAGDGNVHVNLLPELARPDWEAAVAALLADVTAAQLRLGGTPSGEHGDGRLRAPFLERLYGPELVRLFELVRRAFDPQCIFNPDVKTPTAPAPIARLKAGAGAAPLPDDIANGLRTIERTGGYAKWRMELV